MPGRSRSPRRSQGGSPSKSSASRSKYGHNSKDRQRRSSERRPRSDDKRREREFSPTPTYSSAPVDHSPDHSRPRHGPSHPKPKSRSRSPLNRRSQDRSRNFSSSHYRPAPGHRRSRSPRLGPPRGYGHPRGRSPGRGGSRGYAHSRHHSPGYYPPPRHHSPNRGPPRHHSPGPHRIRSPGPSYSRDSRRSPGPRYHRGGAPRHRSPVYQERPPSRGVHHSRGGTTRRYSGPSPQRPRSRSGGRMSRSPPPMNNTPPRYEMGPHYGTDGGSPPHSHGRSPEEVPRVPRDQRSPPRILPPRPKHLRSPITDSQQPTAPKERKSSRSPLREKSPKIERTGRLGSPKPSNKVHSVRSPHKPAAPPPPSISSHEPTSPVKSSKIQVSISDQGGSRMRAVVSKDSEKDMAVSNTSTGMSGDWAVFRGPEMDKIDSRELKKIQIDIRRNIPDHKKRDGPVIRSLDDPLKLEIPRSINEGSKQIFDRDEILMHTVKEEKVEEQRVMIITEPLEEYERKLGSEIEDGLDMRKNRDRSRSPHEKQQDERGRKRNSSPRRDEDKSPEKRSRYSDRGSFNHKDNMDRIDIRTRLGGREKSPRDEGRIIRDVRERLGERHIERKGVSVRERLGDQVLDRERLEAGRPDVKPWEAEPEMVPREGRYWDHDSREGKYDREGGGRGGYSHRGYHRGSRNFRSHRGRGGFNSYRGRGRRQDYGNRRSETDWKHDKYHQEEPSSTTD